MRLQPGQRVKNLHNEESVKLVDAGQWKKQESYFFLSESWIIKVHLARPQQNTIPLRRCTLGKYFISKS